MARQQNASTEGGSTEQPRKAAAETNDSQAAVQPTPGRVVDNTPPADALADDKEVAEVQQAVKDRLDEENEKGYRGTAADPTPNENYTLAGVTDPNVHVPEEFKVRTGAIVYPGDVVGQNSKG